MPRRQPGFQLTLHETNCCHCLPQRPAGSGRVGHPTPAGPLQVHADASSTSALPTIRSDADLEAYQHRLRQRAEAGPLTPQVCK